MRWRGQGPALSVQVLTRTNEDAVKWSWDHSHAHHFREDSSAANDYFSWPAPLPPGGRPYSLGSCDPSLFSVRQ